MERDLKKKSFYSSVDDKHLRGDVDDEGDALGYNDYKTVRKYDLPIMMIRMLYCIIIINVPHKMANDYQCPTKDELPIMMRRMLFCIIIINVPQKIIMIIDVRQKMNYQLF